MKLDDDEKLRKMKNYFDTPTVDCIVKTTKMECLNNYCKQAVNFVPFSTILNTELNAYQHVIAKQGKYVI